MRLLLFLLLICVNVFAKMTDTEALVYMLQLAHECAQNNVGYLACRNGALRVKPELYHHYGFMRAEFRDYYTWTRKLATPDQAAAISEYYAQFLAQK